MLLISGIVETEWKGGFGPRLVFRRVKPDFDKLEANRALQTNSGRTQANQTNSGSIYWTDFRGPNRDGRYDQQPLLADWPKSGPKEVWRQPVGGGYASFVIARGRVFTIEQRREKEFATAYDLASGREIWSHGWAAKFNDDWDMGGIGPRTTPTWHEGRVYVLGAQGEFACLNETDGAVLWRKNLLTEHQSGNLDFGLSASPLVTDEKIIVPLGRPEGNQSATLVALHKITGKLIWKSNAERLGYSSPMLVTLAGRRQILLCGSNRALGINPDDGKILWEFPLTVPYGNNIAQPVLLGDDKIFFSAGYGAGCVAIEILKKGNAFDVSELWRNKQMKNKFTSSVLWQGHIYGLDEDILVCLDAATGKRKWKDGRYGYGQILLANGLIIVLCGDGDLALVKADAERHHEIARVPALKGKTWSHPAVADGKLLIRNAAEMACYDLSIPTKPVSLP
ncbi:MAG: hypothetical protein EXS24_01460 [Pedosphaera sp.]|nr:hypothetical protein [Pedosphaera sp.]